MLMSENLNNDHSLVIDKDFSDKEDFGNNLLVFEEQDSISELHTERR